MPDQTEVYIADVSCLCDDSLWEKRAALLSEARVKKALSFASDKDRCLSLGAGLLLRHGLQKYGIEEKTAKIYYNEHGKPFLTNENIFFSLSHSGCYALCALSCNNVGADIQKKVRWQPAVVKRFFAQKEQQYIFSLPEKERADAFFRLWALKESCVKMLGTGLSGMISELSIKMQENSAAAYQKQQPLPYIFTEYNIEGYAAAVCGAKQTAKLLLLDLKNDFEVKRFKRCS